MDTEPTAIPCYMYDEYSMMYIGEGLAYPSPMDPGEYYYPPNATLIAPPSIDFAAGRGYRMNEACTAWIEVDDWSCTPLYDTLTAEPYGHHVEPGKPLPRDATPLVPPVDPDGVLFPNFINGEWALEPSLLGVVFHNGLGDEYVNETPWRTAPDGYEPGRDKNKAMADARKEATRLLMERIRILELVTRVDAIKVDSPPNARSGLPKKAKSVDILLDETSFQDYHLVELALRVKQLFDVTTLDNETLFGGLSSLDLSDTISVAANKNEDGTYEISIINYPHLE